MNTITNGMCVCLLSTAKFFNIWDLSGHPHTHFLFHIEFYTFLSENSGLQRYIIKKNAA